MSELKGIRAKLNPFDVVIQADRRCRSKPQSLERIAELAFNMFTYGQAQDIVCREHEGKPAVVIGFTRTAAGRLIREGFEREVLDRNEKGEEVLVKKTIHNPEFMLSARIDKALGEDEALVVAMAEQCNRDDYTVIDIAENCDTLRRPPYNFTDRKIAEIFRMTPGRVSQLKEFLGLDKKLKDAIQDGQVSGATALLLNQVPKDKWASVLHELKEGSGISPAEIRGKVRDWILDDRKRNQFEKAHAEGTATEANAGGETGAATPPNGAAPATAPEQQSPVSKPTDARALWMGIDEVVRNFKELCYADVGMVSPKVQSLFALLASWVQGTAKSKEVYDRLEELFELPKNSLPEPK